MFKQITKIAVTCSSCNQVREIELSIDAGPMPLGEPFRRGIAVQGQDTHVCTGEMAKEISRIEGLLAAETAAKNKAVI